ncbi:glycerophosphodiester phosphodiesterase family protein [Streptococcus panodentis]|uniref:Glycerophosphodiester phosphodiesterase n=1 Tax=Streptococcus panodentis TaxID=1581472 RepID=A0ABS5B0A8_9STRE|nr:MULTISPECIES: glycerophosphodiester phosphodiesterase family protein [Streptococcus]KXT85289.1 Glycerophosphoryl diester phosphodiesterase [Streptococcus sp. DD11]MBP2622267.1 glycerophosphodiester phosphodiesterase [Streptococcus panodentis]
MIGQESYKEVNHFLNQELGKKKVLIAVHRGSSAGNIVENTIPAYEASLQMGGDIVEADVFKTSDDKLYHFHNGMERKNFQKDFDIRRLSSQELKDLAYCNSNLSAISYPVEKLEDTLRYFKGRCLINIDRAWDFFSLVCDLVKKEEMVNQVILKGPLEEETLRFFAEEETKFLFMPKISKLSQLELLKQYPDVNIIGVEIKAETEADDFYQTENIQKLKEANLCVWINALTMNDEKKLFAGHDDNVSILKSEDEGWGILLEKGADIIQTDWPSLVSQYLVKRGII